MGFDGWLSLLNEHDYFMLTFIILIIHRESYKWNILVIGLEPLGF